MLIDSSRPDPARNTARPMKKDERALLPHRDRRPQADQPAAEIDAGQEPMHVVEPRRRLRLPQVHLQRAARQRDDREQEQADLDDALACGASRSFAGIATEARVINPPSSPRR